MGCGGKLGTIFLVTLNIIFSLLGLGIMIVGILLKTNSSLVESDIMPVMNQVQFNGYNLGDLLVQLSTFVICVGVFILVISALGLIGVCCRSKIILVIYAIIVLILLIAEIAAVALFAIMKEQAETVVKDELTKALQNNYQDDTLAGVDDVTKGWNVMFMTMHCCGISAFETKNDFTGTTKWTNKGSSVIPVFCCKGVTTTNFADAKYLTGTGSEAACHEAPTSAKSYTTLGCYDAVKNEVTQYSSAAIGIGVVILIVQLLCVIFAFCICKSVGKDEVV